MKARLSYSLTALENRPCCEIEVFEDSSDEHMFDFAIGETFAEVREEAIKGVRDALSRCRDSSLEIPASEEIEL